MMSRGVSCYCRNFFRFGDDLTGLARARRRLLETCSDSACPRQYWRESCRRVIKSAALEQNELTREGLQAQEIVQHRVTAAVVVTAVVIRGHVSSGSSALCSFAVSVRALRTSVCAVVIECTNGLSRARYTAANCVQRGC